MYPVVREPFAAVKAPSSRREGGRYACISPSLLQGRPRSFPAALSLVEVLVVVAIITVIAGFAITSLTGGREAASASVAKGNLNLLNGAVTKMNNAGMEIVLSPDPDASDEAQVFTTLQARDTNNPIPGSPFLPADLQFEATSDTDRNRGMWNGRFFQLVPEGTPGTGIDLQKMNANLGS